MRRHFIVRIIAVAMAGIGFFAVAGTVIYGQGACQNLYGSSATIPAGFGAPTDFFSGTNGLMLKATSCTATTVNIQAGTGAGSQYIYTNGYRWDGGQWVGFAFGGSNHVADQWYAGQATATIVRAAHADQYFVGYVCSQVNGAWKCGCKDQACAAPFWQLQGVAVESASSASGSTSVLWLKGTNLSGAEFGTGLTYGTNYTYPTHAEADYFKRKGMNFIRLPFRWERMQRSENAALDSAELSHMDDFVAYATGIGLSVAIEPHFYGWYNNRVVGVDVPAASFADLWKRLADHYKSNARVIFDLGNEPHDMPTSAIQSYSQAAVTAIRATGAGNLILIEGNGWSGAETWVSAGNDVLADIVDPKKNYYMEVHNYLDSDRSGTHADCVSATVGVDRLTKVTEWARVRHQRLLLGEFGGGANDTCKQAVTNMLTYIKANADVWAGWAWWSAGPWWGEYFMTLEPLNGQDRPQMAWLTPFVP